MITIEVTNNKCRLYGDIKLLMNIQKAFKVKNPNAYFIRLRGNVQSNWDGMIWYVTESNYFKIGLLPQVYNYIKNTLKELTIKTDLTFDFEIIKDRRKFKSFEFTIQHNKKENLLSECNKQSIACKKSLSVKDKLK